MRGIYAFSGDPITYGHLDIIKRAAKLVSDLVVGIGVNPSKRYLFSLEERLEMAQECLKDISNVTVVAFKGLLVDYAYENDIDVIIRGIRNSGDFEYEQNLFLAGESQKLDIEVIPMFAKPELAHVSSSTVKELQKEQGKIYNYVPLSVKNSLEVKMLNQFVIGVTGTLGTGKSYVSEKLVQLGSKHNVSVHNIDLDKIGHDILSYLKEPIYVKIRKQLVEHFGEEIENEDGSISRKKLGDIVFDSEKDLGFLNSIMRPAIEERMRKEMYGKQGLILINGALIAESNMLYVCNNNVLIITADEDTQVIRLQKRNYSSKQIKNRIKSQYNTGVKKEAINKKIQEDKHGQMWILDTTSENQEDIENVLEEILKYSSKYQSIIK